MALAEVLAVANTIFSARSIHFRDVILPMMVVALLATGCDRDTPPISIVSRDGSPLAVGGVPSFADVAAKALPGVVSIAVQERATAEPRSPIPFFAPPPQDGGIRRGTGSGFIVSPDGFVLTNYHVIENATRVVVRMADGQTTKLAQVVGRDPETDIALLKIDGGRDLPALTLGDSDLARPGDWAIAVGNPLQFENTVTVGVVSANGRALGISETTAAFEAFIQTDAAINPGNSGGPLLNARGEVIGISTAVRAAAQNIGFATPVNTVKRILEELKKNGRVRRGYLGTSVEEIDDRFQRAFNLPTREGVLVQSVQRGSAADTAGLRRGDVILETNGEKINTSRELIDFVAYTGPGRPIELRIIRDGREQSLRVVTAERPSALPQISEASPATGRQEGLGLSLQPVPEIAQASFGLDSADGALVMAVTAGSPADDAGIRSGDIIIEADGSAVTAPEQLRSILSSAAGQEFVRLYVVRPFRGSTSPQAFYTVVDLPGT
jgi:serine protease Do